MILEYARLEVELVRWLIDHPTYTNDYGNEVCRVCGADDWSEQGIYHADHCRLFALLPHCPSQFKRGPCAYVEGHEGRHVVRRLPAQR